MKISQNAADTFGQCFRRKGRFAMAKVAFLVPYQDMCDLVRSMLEEEIQHITPVCVEYVPTPQIRGRVRELEQQGCDLIVARGVHASIARQTVKIPVTEIRLATQELGTSILELKRELDRERPVLGLIGFANMFGSTNRFNDLFQIELHSYMVVDSQEMTGAVAQAIADGCQAVIGGDLVCRDAQRQGLPCRFLFTGEEGVRRTLEIVSHVCYAIDQEKSASAEMETMLTYTFSGIIQVDRGGIVRRINRAGYNLLEKMPGDIIGKTVTESIPGLSAKTLESVLSEGMEIQSMVLTIQQKAVLVNIVPVQIDGDISGALFTIQEGKRIIEMDSKLRWELHQQGYIAKHTFDRMIANGKEMKGCLALAQRVAKYPAPILLLGEMGVGKGFLAECIHNDSLRRGGAFVPLDCSAWQADTLDSMLFGTYSIQKSSPTCMAEQAQDGTLYLSHVEALPMETQYKLLNLIQGRFLHNGPNRPVSTDVRVIASTDANLAGRVERGEFRRDLYYALNVLSLELPPLRRRREDLSDLFDRYLGEWQDKFKRYFRLTPGAYQFIQKYDWPGNLDQINSLCERIVLLSEKRNIDETFLQQQLEQVTPKLVPGTDTVILYKDQKAVELAELLKRNNGNREKVAAELGISKTTLWRRIKKYGIEKDFSY